MEITGRERNSRQRIIYKFDYSVNCCHITKKSILVIEDELSISFLSRWLSPEISNKNKLSENNCNKYNTELVH